MADRWGRRASLIVSSVLLVSTCGFAARFHLARGAKEETSATENELVIPSEIEAIAALGRIEPASRIRRIVPPGESRTGTIAKMHVSAGDWVAKEQILAELDNHERLAADIAVSQSLVQVAESKLNQILAGIHPLRIDAKRVEIETVSSQLKMLELDLRRAQKLVSSSAMSAQMFEETKWKVENATLVQERLRKELSEIEDVREVDIQLARAELAKAKAELQKSIVRCKLSEVRSPIDGQILRIHAREGEAVGDLGLLEMANVNQMQAVAEVFEADASRVSIGMRAHMNVVSSGLKFGGTVVELGKLVGRQVVLSGDPVSDVDARVIEVRINVDSESVDVLSHLSNARVEVVFQAAASPAGDAPTGHSEALE